MFVVLKSKVFFGDYFGLYVIGIYDSKRLLFVGMDFYNFGEQWSKFLLNLRTKTIARIELTVVVFLQCYRNQEPK